MKIGEDGRIGIKIPGDYQYTALRRGHKAQRFWHGNKINFVRSILRISANDVILDAGCGSGNFILEFASQCRSIYGVDASRDAIMFAQRIARQSNLKNAYFILAPVTSLPFQDNMFSKILLVDVIEHITNFEDCLSELRRVLKPGGKLVITTPNYRSLWPVIEYITDALKITCMMRKEQHKTKFTQPGLSYILEKSGFKIKSLGSIYYISPFVAALSQKLAQRIFEREIKWDSKLGALLYFVIEK